MKSFKDKVAVITGGASGIGLAIVRALLKEGAKVVIADVEQKALDRALGELNNANASGVVTDVSKLESLQALADTVYSKHGACHLLFNNAGVGVPGMNIWESEVNDWKWLYNVNVMGVVQGIMAFVPRMLAGGEEGHIINTSSSDGGIAPLADQAVYASSKAAVSIITECLASQLKDSKIKVTLFYPSGGVLATGLWTTHRNRPQDLPTNRQTVSNYTADDFARDMKAQGVDLQFQNLDQLAVATLNDLRTEKFVSMIGVEDAAAQLRYRADCIGRSELPLDMAHMPRS